MFNLIVSGNGNAWEKPPYSMDRSRFGEYSGEDAQGISLKESASLQALIGIPTILMYELGAHGDNVRLVRYGRLTRIELAGKNLQFNFTPDNERAYIPRARIQEFAESLGMDQFEDYRTHWAVKDGDIPTEVIEHGQPEPPQRDIKLVSSELSEAIATKNDTRAAALKQEISSFPPSLDKAVEYLRENFNSSQSFEALKHLGASQEDCRTLVESVIEQNRFAEIKNNRPFSLVWLLENYGAPTEERFLDDAVAACEEVLRGILAKHSALESFTEDELRPLWQCISCHTLKLRLRRVINGLLARFASCQSAEGYWHLEDQPDLRITSMMVVVLQRLGNDSHRTAIRSAVLWLCNNSPYKNADLFESRDLVAMVLALEAVRRSGMLVDLEHVTAAGDRSVHELQRPLGYWQAEKWEKADTTVLVMDYFSRSGSMLEQVDGFLLMSRDFFRKAEELAYEGGVNNRRLSAIAAVHAMEMFLYGLFERREDLGISAFGNRGQQTLGPRESLATLQRRLQEEKILVDNRELSYRDQLSTLVGHRDMVIHRASEISFAELDRGMKAVEGFIRKYGADLMKIELLQ